MRNFTWKQPSSWGDDPDRTNGELVELAHRIQTLEEVVKALVDDRRWLVSVLADLSFERGGSGE